MRLAILGSRNVLALEVENFVRQAVEALVNGINRSAISIGTFLNGGVHETAAALADEWSVRLIRFHSVSTLANWSPDTVLIFWDGRSRGCQACLEQLSHRGIFCMVFVKNSLTARYLGSNAHLISPSGNSYFPSKATPLSREA